MGTFTHFIEIVGYAICIIDLGGWTRSYLERILNYTFWGLPRLLK